MQVLISNAYAQAAAASSGPGFDINMLFIPLMVVVFYFLLIRPQQKRAKDQRSMIEALKSGDEVVTVGGVLGKIAKLSDQYATLEIAEARDQSVEIIVQRSAIQTLLPKGTIKSV
jgi:preprotein translocase subunit YajC